MQKMPLIFIGHGSPMNALEDNKYTQSWREIGQSLEKPRAILMFSAHWITQGETRISTSEYPQMIYDMGGFPQELYRIQYRAQGSSEIAEEIMESVAKYEAMQRVETRDSGSSDSGIGSNGFQKQYRHIRGDSNRGFDHGVWSTLVHLFPMTDIPVITMSLDMHSSPRRLYALGKSLASLRSRGILIIGSGNIVHNLSAIDSTGEYVNPWAIDFDRKISDGIKAGKNTLDFTSIFDFQSWGEIANLAQPSHDHLLPLFPILGASDTDDVAEFYTPEIAMGSISMRSIVWR